VLEQRIEERNRTNITTVAAILGSTPLPSQATTISLGSEMRTLEVARRKNQLPDSSEFHGKRSEFRAWLIQVQAKLSVDKLNDTEAVRLTDDYEVRFS
jgi:hypothetical protein